MTERDRHVILRAMNRRDVIIGLVILALVAGLVYWFRKPAKNKLTVSTPAPSVVKNIENRFNLTIPDNLEKAELKDITGGEGSGLATRSYENAKFTLTVLANLPDLTQGAFYQVWLVKDGTNLSLGKMRVAKGGFLLEFEANKNYSDYKKVLVTLEKVLDSKVEKQVLEGSF